MPNKGSADSPTIVPWTFSSATGSVLHPRLGHTAATSGGARERLKARSKGYSVPLSQLSVQSVKVSTSGHEKNATRRRSARTAAACAQLAWKTIQANTKILIRQFPQSGHGGPDAIHFLEASLLRRANSPTPQVF